MGIGREGTAVVVKGGDSIGPPTYSSKNIEDEPSP
jgi:hypothetical protein